MPARAHPPPSPRGARRFPRHPAAPEDAARSLEELRRSIVGEERERIERLEGRPEVAAEPVGSVLPEAIATATAARKRDLAVALEPTVTDAVTSVARRRPDIYADALAPTIGSAVRKAVADAMAVMIQRFDAALERSLTLRSIQWRVEAARTGQPFGEIALLHTLIYRVEQVFLIHTRTSLVLQHLVDPGVQAPAPDQVAALLAAIEAFAREAFGPTPPGVHLNRFALGELTVCIRHQPPLTLAAVVRGTPSAAITLQMDDALSRVRVQCAAGLGEFAGEVAPFDAARPILDPLLRMVRKRPPRRAAILLAVAGISVVAAVIALAASTHVHQEAIARKERAYVAALQGEPGIVVNQVQWKGAQAQLSGFRDPLAAPPETVLARHGLAPAALDLAPFASLDPRIVEQRARGVLRPPPGVAVHVEGQSLVLAGTAPGPWVDQARWLGRAVAGVEHVDDSALRSQESLSAARAAASEARCGRRHVPHGKVAGRPWPAGRARVRRRALSCGSRRRRDGPPGSLPRGDRPHGPDRDGATQRDAELRACVRRQRAACLDERRWRRRPPGRDQTVAGSPHPQRLVPPGHRRGSLGSRVWRCAVRKAKVCLIGATAVGKSSLVSRYVKSIFSDQYKTTIGVKIESRVVERAGSPLELVVWDLSGEDEFQNVQPSYLRGAWGYHLVIDGTRRETVDVAAALEARVRATIGSVPFVVVLNKSDLVAGWELTAEDVERMRGRGWRLVEASARTGTGVERAFDLLVDTMLHEQPWI